MKLFRFIFFILLLAPSVISAQEVDQQREIKTRKNNIVIDYNYPKEYVVGGLDVVGITYLGKEQLVSMTGIQQGDRITVPSEELSGVLKRIWAQRFFSNVEMYIDSLVPTQDTAFFVLELQERPRVSGWYYSGIRNSEQTDLKERLSLKRGGELSEYVIKNSTDIIKKYFAEKGYINAEVEVIQQQDSLIRNAVRVTFDVKRNAKVKIKEITFEGNNHVKESKLVGSMKDTRDMRIRNFFKSKKFKEEEYENDKLSLIEAFNEAGFRDATIVKDSIYVIEDGRLGIHFVIDEGQRYYFRNITWTGNSIYTEEALNSVLMIGKGDVYDVVTLERRLFGGDKANEIAVQKLYSDNGYLFFNVVPVEVNIIGDSVDVEIRMVEGKPATFNNIIINGNTITNEKVVRRQIYTRPGYIYRQTQFEQSLREIASMGHFEPEKAMTPNSGWVLLPNQLSNTVDVIYNLEEKPNSQFELSGGWGGYSFVGTVGLHFNNFSIKNIFNKRAWRPVPLGDAQTLSFRFQTNGMYYTALSASFLEPWLFGNKPTSLNLTAYYTKQTNSYYLYQNADQYMQVFGLAAGIGKRLNWPDNYFVLYNELSWQTYRLHDWQYNFLFDTGISNNISYKLSLQRNSTDQQIFPREGSEFILSAQLTPPYSLFREKDTDYDSMTDQQRYKWIEYHKWTFKGSLYTKVIGDLVLMTRVNFGYLGYYDRNLGYSPFEGYLVGGDGMSGYNTYGQEVISLRGYSNSSLTPVITRNGREVYAGNIYDKFTIELRYPLVLQPMSTIYALAFLEAGNSWKDIREFNPFQVKRSAGVGVRVMLPMVGLIGIDWGYGFDPEEASGKRRGGGNIHFMMGQQF